MHTDMRYKPIAFYLPQFHPIPENNSWWGDGFTEWTNTASARPLFKGHKQPNLPGELGFYDLRLEDSRIEQADLARRYGVYGFCYWHYWFGGKRILERPSDEVIRNKKPDFPFCFAWANESWTGVWHGLNKKILLEQVYPGSDDHIAHFECLLPAFLDSRYIRIDGKPVFFIYHPAMIPEITKMIELWQNLAMRNGLPGLFFVGIKVNDAERWQAEQYALDLVNSPSLNRALIPMQQNKLKKIANMILRKPRNTFLYKDATNYLLEAMIKTTDELPTLLTNWDNSPRSHRRAVILEGWSPEYFQNYLSRFMMQLSINPPPYGLFLIKSWNEWAEGNYMEPDRRYGRKCLEIFYQEMLKVQND